MDFAEISHEFFSSVKVNLFSEAIGIRYDGDEEH